MLFRSDRRIEICGVSRLCGVRQRVIPDRNEVVSFASAALSTGGSVLVRGAWADYLGAFIALVEQAGGEVSQTPQGIHFSGTGRWHPVRIETAPHPGFMTDWQQPFCVLLTQSAGESIIHETVYEDRFGYTKDLRRMGADIEVSDFCPGPEPCRFSGKNFYHSAKIKGPSKLHGADIMMTDIRAGMAHVIAALVAEGESMISGIEHIDRGYEKIDERLKQLGADIKRVVVS